MFPPAPSAAPLHQLDPAGSAALSPVWEEEEEEENGEGSSTAQIWCFRAPDQLPIGIAADPYNYHGKKNTTACAKTQNCLKGVWVWWGVPRGGRVAVGG